jgi:hypothetical protein
MRIPTVTSAWDHLVRSFTKPVRFPKTEQLKQDCCWSDLLELRESSPCPCELFPTVSRAESFRTGVSKKSLAKYRRWLAPGWRSGVLNCACSVILVFLINFAVTIWGTVHRNAEQEVVFDVDCRKISKINSGLHIIINLLGTVLLGCSNYCMQCLSAPTREEVDRAHVKNIWLDIGTPSIRNLRYIDKRRVIVWGLLGVSSLPLHLFYNSMLYSSIASNDYQGALIKPSFTTDLNNSCTDCSQVEKDLLRKAHGLDIDLRRNTSDIATYMQAKTQPLNGGLQLLENRDCITQYSSSIQTFRRNLLLIIDEATPDHPEKEMPSKMYGRVSFSASDINDATARADAYDWICDKESKNINEKDGWCLRKQESILNDANDWTLNNCTVRYCLSEVASSQCKLHLLLSVGWLVTSLNMLKAMLMLYITFRVKKEPLMTMGDAVASFMEQNDPTTRKMGTATRNEVKIHNRWDPMGPREWKPRKWKLVSYKWYDTTSKTRRITMFVS